MWKKKNWLGFFAVLFLSIIALCADDTKPVKLPFWKAKAEVYRRIKEERAIIVSARSETLDDEHKKLILTGAGRISAPLTFAHTVATQYGNYSQILPYVTEAAFDKETNKIFAKGSFMGFRAEMVLQVSDEIKVDNSQVHFEVVSGFLKGMTGNIFEEKISDEVTEISLIAEYLGKLDLPAFIMNWGLEFAGHKMASKMRSHIEELWEKEKK